METRNLSARTSIPKVADNFGYAVLVTCVAILTSADERQLFTYGVSTNNTLLLLWTLATVAQWIFKRAEQSEPYTDMVIHTITAGVVALVTLGGMHLAIALVATAVLFVAAYCTVIPTNEQLASTEHVPRAHKRHNTSYWTIGFVVIAFTFIMYTHVNWFNTRDLRAPALPGLNSTIDFNDHNMPEGERKMYRLQCLHKTRSAYIEMLSPYFRRGRNYTILDYPNHWNLGDAFIYVGQDIMFSVYGQVPLRPPYPHVSTIQLQRVVLIIFLRLLLTLLLQGYHNISDGVIFLHGGGNFGDIYPYFDNYRTRITSTFKNHSIVMLPQSVHYKDPKRLARMVIAYRHKDLTMMLRDHESQMYVQGNFTYAKAPYVPDSAFMIGPQLPNSDPVVDVFYLLRLDHEIAINYTMYNPKALAAQYGLSAEVWDFPLSFPVHIRKNKTVLQDMADIYPGRLLNPKLLPSTEAITWYRTQMGNTMLSRGRVVIADRLHASIMATLIGRPVVYVDNNYRKTTRVRSSLTQFIPECTDTVLDAHYAPDLATAVKIAADLIKKMEPNRL